jgi:hypothetical protein
VNYGKPARTDALSSVHPQLELHLVTAPQRGYSALSSKAKATTWELVFRETQRDQRARSETLYQKAVS